MQVTVCVEGYFVHVGGHTVYLKNWTPSHFKKNFTNASLMSIIPSIDNLYLVLN